MALIERLFPSMATVKLKALDKNIREAMVLCVYTSNQNVRLLERINIALKSGRWYSENSGKLKELHVLHRKYAEREERYKAQRNSRCEDRIEFQYKESQLFFSMALLGDLKAENQAGLDGWMRVDNLALVTDFLKNYPLIIERSRLKLSQSWIDNYKSNNEPHGHFVLNTLRAFINQEAKRIMALQIAIFELPEDKRKSFAVRR